VDFFNDLKILNPDIIIKIPIPNITREPVHPIKKNCDKKLAKYCAIPPG
jgi:hypothetical protein